MSESLIATQWSPNSIRQEVQGTGSSVVMVVVPSTGSKGTGWFVSDRHVVTNKHVVQEGAANEIQLVFSNGDIQQVANIQSSTLDDLAVLTTDPPQSSCPLKIDCAPVTIGTQVYAWGHPLGYNGPAPLLTVGYVAGANKYPRPAGGPVLRIVLNAALNPGNSGGPVVVWGETAVRGVVVSKHAPITPYLQSAMDALANQQNGFMYTQTDANGNQTNISEGQVVAAVLQYFRSMTQVVIGEAIAANDLVAFLDNNNIPWSAV